MSRLLKPQKNFTMLSNVCIKDNTITHAAKGLIALMMSLPDTWNFTISGLANDKISVEGKDKIRREIKELEEHRYLVRIQNHNASGKFSNNDYIINDEPMSDEFINDFLSERKKSQPSESSIPDITKISPLSGNPTTDLPSSVSPSTVKPTQNNIINNKYYNNISINQDTYRCEEMDSIDKIDKQEIAEKIKKQVNYPKLTEEYEQDKSMIDSIVGILADAEASCAETMRIAKEDKPLAEIKARFAQLTNEHIAYVLECISAQSRKPRNIKSYLLTALYNAPATMGAYFTAKARERPAEITDSDLIDYKSLVNNFL